VLQPFWEEKVTMEKVETIIVGSGFGGLGMAAGLLRDEKRDFLILEKASELGGTWRHNSYPGAECDVPSLLYSYSYEQNPEWSMRWAPHNEILDYQMRFVEKYDLAKHARRNQQVEKATFDEKANQWTVETLSGDTFKCQFLIFAVGQLHYPYTPKFPNDEAFAGPRFHSAEWRTDVDLGEKNVAVIGAAASAIQLIPEVAEQAKQVTVYQRSPNWLLPKRNTPFSDGSKRIFQALPIVQKLLRFYTWAYPEFMLYPAIKGSWFNRKLLKYVATRHLRRSIKDESLRAKLTPDYQIGAKRVLLSSAYYPAVARANVELVTDPIGEMAKDGITDKSGVHRHHDVLVYATGFKTNPFLPMLQITGKSGVDIREVWKEGAHAYLGVAVPDFPNMFMLYGPNTNTGHSSVILKLECQIDYIRQLVGLAGTDAIDVRAEVESKFNIEVQNRLRSMAWNAVEASWYKDGDRITNNWPGPSREYIRKMRHPDPSDYVVS
jgi:cation diffusion facilitator CzcD-associated flavoprotein CzcO